MRKLLALVATMAMVLSMFSGIAFAALDASYRVVLTENATIISSNTASDIVIVKGMAYHNNVAMTSGTIKVAGFDFDPNTLGNQETVAVNADGSFFFPVDRNAAPASYTVELQVGNPLATVAEAKLTRKANATIQTPSFEYKANPLETLRIALTDVNGKALDSALVGQSTTVTLVNTDDSNITGTVQAVYPSTGALLVLVNHWGGTGDFDVNLNGVAHGTITVTEVGSLGITAMPTASINLNVPTHVVLNLTGPESASVDVTLTGPGTLTLLPAAVQGNPAAATQTYTLDSAGKKEVAFDATFDATGSYTFTINKSGYKSAKVVMSVVTPTAGVYEYIRTDKLTEMSVGSNTITVGPGKEYELVSYTNNAQGTPVKDTNVTYSASVDGSSVTLTPDNALNPTYWTIPVKTTKLGEVKVRIASSVGGVKKLDKEFTVKVTGWDVSFDVNKFIVNQEQNLTFTIKDADGNAINNAQIYVVDYATAADWAAFQALNPRPSMLVNPTTTNVSNGTYTKKNLKFSTTGQRNIFVLKGNGSDLMAQFSKGINVTGESVYNVTSNVSTLLSGKKQAVTLTVTGGGSDMAQFVEKQIGSDITQITPVSVSGDTLKFDLQNDGTKDITLRVYNGSGDKCGEVVVKTVAPKLVFDTETTTATENVYTGLKFQVVDPRDNTVLNKDVKISGVNVPTLEVYTADHKGTLNTTLNASTQFDVALLVKGIDWDTLDKFDDEAKVQFKVTMATGTDVKADGTLSVVKASLASNPSQVILGQPTTLTLTYTDGNGVAIADKKVYQGTDKTGAELGTTDDNGQLVVVNQAATSSLKFAAATDVADKYAVLTVTVGTDTAAPVVSAPETSDKNTAILTFTDNVRVTRLMVNGVEINIIPRTEVKHVVNLVAGANSFDVVAIDNSYNVLEQTVTINYAPATPDVTVVMNIGSTTYTVNGVAKTMEAAPAAQNGTTMVPASVITGAFGATSQWDGATKTATYTANGHTVKVTLGSTTAVVDGQTKTLAVAASAVGGRTMVPVRLISEGLGYNVAYANGVITITK